MTANWPQITLIVLSMISGFLHAVKDGEPQKRTYDFKGWIISAGITYWILWCGGFFG